MIYFILGLIVGAFMGFALAAIIRMGKDDK